MENPSAIAPLTGDATGDRGIFNHSLAQKSRKMAEIGSGLLTFLKKS
ncbi:MAG: hypothetical protein ACP5D7_06705 [Limnospira sp.]